MSIVRMAKKPLVAIAGEIAAHLKRFEEDPVINAKPVPMTSYSNPLPHPYGSTACRRTLKGVMLNYQPFFAYHDLDRETAQRYLTWLDAGGVGTHLEMEKSK
jgi:hypothetical protein